MRDGLTRTIHVGFSLFAPDAVRLAALPLLEAGHVDALEWTIDHGWSQPEPDWVTALLDAYAAEDRLYGHCVGMSPGSARPGAAMADWLARLARETGRRRYRHVTEHWGFSRAGVLVHGAPLPLVSSEAAVACAARALRELAAAARVPVGLENLALALSPGDVEGQPAMLARALDGPHGVLLLDLHNVWCQAVNHDRDPRELLGRYPLARARQLHVAGGSWSGRPRFRRDTHDALVPAEVLDLVAWVIPRCPALEVVVLERLPGTLDGEPARRAWRDEWLALADVVRRAAREPLAPAPPAAAAAPLADARSSIDDLARFQDAVVGALLAGGAARDAQAALLAHPDAAPYRDQVASWEPRAIEVAIELAHKWGITGEASASPI